MRLAHPELLEHVVDETVGVAVLDDVVVEFKNSLDRHVVIGVEESEVLDVQEANDVVPLAFVDRDAREAVTGDLGDCLEVEVVVELQHEHVF